MFEAACDRTPTAVALECDGARLTYQELDERANRLAHRLRAHGIGGGARTAILLQRSVATYVALLAVGKAGGAFVPIDPESPADRVAYIAEDSGIALLLTSAELADRADGLACPVLIADDVPDAASHRPARDLVGDQAAYVIYTSGSSGRPKGVEVAQSSICNFLDVVPRVYDVRPGDRVYQGMTIAFDFSIEEIWPTWSVGATLVAGPTDSRRFGVELADFLDTNAVTVFYCVPTLLATIPRELPRIRSVLVGGEACPGQLVERWSRPGRRILNTYGPTEATVTATWCELLPGRIVTIGRPLPTYSVVLLDEQRRPTPDGEVGEICIGGPGVARGYVGRPELTADRFIEHPLAPPGSRLYRTGDLGRLTADGEIEYLGRADAEVKIRGHRVDLGEIESVLLEDHGVAEAVVALDAAQELAAYVVRPAAGGEPDDVVVRRLAEQLQDRLPGYMVPAYLDVVEALPAMPSGKVDRKRLPPPVNRRPARGSGPVVAAEGDREEQVRAVWAEVFGLPPEQLSVEADFFDDLGGHSLLAARVVSLLRTRDVCAGAAVRELYSHPTVRGMARRMTVTAGPTAPPRPAPLRHDSRRIATAGTGQALVIYLLVLLVTLPVSYVYTWNNGRVSVEVLVQLMMAILVSYLGVRWVVPVLLARPVAAGIRPGRYRLWGPTYLRLWTLNLLLAIGPMAVISGSPLMALYLRLLGARVGARTTIATSSVSLPTLIDIGADASIGYGVSMRPWRVEDGWVVVEPITVAPHAFVGANAVLEPGSTVGANAGLGEQSVLEQGETVPPGTRWAGSPATPVAALGPTVEVMLGAAGRGLARGWHLKHLLAATLGVVGLELSAIATILPSVVLVWWVLLEWGLLAGLFATVPAGPLYVLTTCAVVALGKRLVLRHAPAGIHPARSGLGIRKWVTDKLLEFSLLFTNSLYSTLYTVPWLRLLGARVGRGAEVSTAAHLDPDLLTLEPDSFVADMASVGAATFANGRMALLPTRVGHRAFVGNAAFVPAGTTLGAGSLVGVQTLPPDDDVPDGTSWLGSPAMHLPLRQSSGTFSEEQTFSPPRRLVAHRLAVEFARVTAPASLLGMSVYLYLWVLSSLARGRDLPVPALVSPLVVIAAGAAVIGCCAATKRSVIGAYRPRVEPLWSTFVRRTEFVTGLYEAAAIPAGVGMLVGTPFLPPVLRWFGARIGRRTWIGTTYLTEFDLVEIGDDATVGAEVSLQTHLFEDRVMKMSVVTVGAGATIGTRAIVLYDAVVGDDVSLGSLSLLMKGEHLTPGSRWRGIPAQGVTTRPAITARGVAKPVIVAKGVAKPVITAA
ncbi:Pls/PosA family non-ribosomal peptide synthetase [Dactylosporangium siamense]|uniref:Peptide synthetase n=1 Tax=Dactylosporangium siamense TaxID=685454 RepID=A0A919PIL0_9ACTN|nr:Pls/PosA family non-ribosomal peptide synthetase [Dactylosporangium siamense]GIG45481.1 peptide synthetase [Dactylosporangium siamense]